MRRPLLVVVLVLALVAAPLVLGDVTDLAQLVVDRFAPASYQAAPSVSLASPLEGDGVAGVVHVAGTAVAGDAQRGVADVEWRLDGRSWQSVPSLANGAVTAPFAFDAVVPDGTHVVEVRATDGDVRSLVARATFRSAESAPPATRILSPQDGAGLAPGDVVVSGVTSAPARHVFVAVDGASEAEAAVAGVSWTLTVPLASGLHKIAARADDGLASSVTVAAGSDAAAPTLLVLSPAGGSAFGATGSADCDKACVRFSGLATGDASEVLVSLDGGALRALDATFEGSSTPTPAGLAWQWNLSTNGLANGAHDVTLVARSAAGSSAPRTVLLTAHTPRTIAIVGDDAPQLTGTPLAFRLDGARGSQVTWRLDGVVVSELSGATVWLNASGDHVLEAIAENAGVARLPLWARDRPPVVDSVRAIAALAGAPSALGVAASDADGRIASFEWSFGDSTTAIVTNGTVTHVYPRPGSYAATVVVVDDEGVPSSPASVTIVVPDQPPLANFSVDPEEPSLLDDVTFTDLSTDADGAVQKASWDFGEAGAAATGHVVRHAFGTRGDHVVALVAQDAEGAVGTVARVVHVRNLAPVAAFRVLPESPQTGEPVAFADASVKLDGAIRSWVWDFGDGERTAGPNVTHTFDAPGRYGVTLLVKDDMGDSGTHRVEVLVRDAAPDVRAVRTEPEAPLALDAVLFRATALDREGESLSFHWDFGDGGTSDEAEPTHRFGHSGAYNVTASATDAKGLTGTLLLTLVVGDAPPTVSFGGLTSAFAGSPTTIRANASDPDGAVVSYLFDMDGDGIADCVTVEPTCTFTYPYPGIWPVWINVTDDEDKGATAYHVIEVRMPPVGLAPPRVTIDAPERDATLRGQFLVRGAASGVAPIERVELQLRNGTWSYSGSSAGWQLAEGTAAWDALLDTRAFPEGLLELVVRATDANGAQGEARVPIRIANERDPNAPQVVVTVMLAPGQEIANDTIVRLVAAHPSGVTSVRWQLDEGEWRAAAGNSMAWGIPIAIRGLTPGEHNLTVDAWHGVTDHAQQRVPFRVAGAVPVLVVEHAPDAIAYGIAHADGHTTPGTVVLYRFDNDVWHQALGAAAWRLDVTTDALSVGPHVLTIKAMDPVLSLEGPPQRYAVSVQNLELHETSHAQSRGTTVRGTPGLELGVVLVGIAALAWLRRK